MEFKGQSDQACHAAEEFSKKFYSVFDKQRHLLAKLYLDISTVVWNGNPYQGVAKINELFINLPATTHELTTMDCQPINSIATPDRTSVLVICEGHVRYGEERTRKPFTQTFVLISDNNTWKIASDCFRLIDKQ